MIKSTEMETRQETVIIDTSEKAIETLHNGENFFEVIDVHFGKCRGDVFQLATMTTEVETGAMRLAGSDNQFTRVNRPKHSEAEIKVLETWKWTGRKWVQVDNI